MLDSPQWEDKAKALLKVETLLKEECLLRIDLQTWVDQDQSVLQVELDQWEFLQAVCLLVAFALLALVALLTQQQVLFSEILDRILLVANLLSDDLNVCLVVVVSLPSIKCSLVFSLDTKETTTNNFASTSSTFSFHIT